jgi:hypothetical protein
MQLHCHCIFVKLYNALTDLFTTGATTQNMVKTDDASVKTEQNKTTQHNTKQIGQCLTHFLCPLMGWPFCTPVLGSHTRISPDLKGKGYKEEGISDCNQSLIQRARN